MSSKVKRKVTVESNKGGDKDRDLDPPRRPSVFERLGPGSISLHSHSQSQERQPRNDSTEKCRNWLRTGLCPYGASCRYTHGPFTQPSPQKKGDREINKKDLRHKVRHKRDKSRESRESSLPPALPPQKKKKHSNNAPSKSEQESKMKSTIVVTRPRSPASEEEQEREPPPTTAWEDDTDDWPLDAAQLDFKEELILEMKRQQLQQELERELEKERLMKENVLITKTVSYSESSSDSDSSSSSSSSSSSNGDSDDDDDSSSSSSSSSGPSEKIKKKIPMKMPRDERESSQPVSRKLAEEKRDRARTRVGHTESKESSRRSPGPRRESRRRRPHPSAKVEIPNEPPRVHSAKEAAAHAEKVQKSRGPRTPSPVLEKKLKLFALAMGPAPRVLDTRRPAAIFGNEIRDVRRRNKRHKRRRDFQQRQQGLQMRTPNAAASLGLSVRRRRRQGASADARPAKRQKVRDRDGDPKTANRHQASSSPQHSYKFQKPLSPVNQAPRSLKGITSASRDKATCESRMDYGKGLLRRPQWNDAKEPSRNRHLSPGDDKDSSQSRYLPSGDRDPSRSRRLSPSDRDVPRSRHLSPGNDKDMSRSRHLSPGNGNDLLRNRNFSLGEDKDPSRNRHLSPGDEKDTTRSRHLSPADDRELSRSRRLSPSDRDLSRSRHLASSGDREPSRNRRLSPTEERDPSRSKYLPVSSDRDPSRNRHLSPSDERDAPRTKYLSVNNDRDPSRNRPFSPSNDREFLHSRHLSPGIERDALRNRHRSPSNDRDTLRSRHLSPTSEREPLSRRHLSPSNDRDSLCNRHLSPSNDRDSLRNRLISLSERDATPRLLPLSNNRDSTHTRVLLLGNERDPSRSRHLSPSNEREPSRNRHLSPSNERDSSRNRHLLPNNDRDSSRSRHLVLDDRDSLRNRHTSPGEEQDPCRGKQISVNNDRDLSRNRHHSPNIDRDVVRNRHLSPNNDRDSARNRHLSPASERDAARNRHVSPGDAREPSQNRHFSPESDRDLRNRHISPGNDKDSSRNRNRRSPRNDDGRKGTALSNRDKPDDYHISAASKRERDSIPKIEKVQENFSNQKSSPSMKERDKIEIGKPAEDAYHRREGQETDFQKRISQTSDSRDGSGGKRDNQRVKRGALADKQKTKEDRDGKKATNIIVLPARSQDQRDEAAADTSHHPPEVQAKQVTRVENNNLQGDGRDKGQNRNRDRRPGGDVARSRDHSSKGTKTSGEVQILSTSRPKVTDGEEYRTTDLLHSSSTHGNSINITGKSDIEQGQKGEDAVRSQHRQSPLLNHDPGHPGVHHLSRQDKQTSFAKGPEMSREKSSSSSTSSVIAIAAPTKDDQDHSNRSARERSRRSDQPGTRDNKQESASKQRSALQDSKPSRSPSVTRKNRSSPTGSNSKSEPTDQSERCSKQKHQEKFKSDSRKDPLRGKHENETRSYTTSSSEKKHGSRLRDKDQKRQHSDKVTESVKSDGSQPKKKSHSSSNTGTIVSSTPQQETPSATSHSVGPETNKDSEVSEKLAATDNFSDWSDDDDELLTRDDFDENVEKKPNVVEEVLLPLKSHLEKEPVTEGASNGPGRPNQENAKQELHLDKNSSRLVPESSCESEVLPVALASQSDNKSLLLSEGVDYDPISDDEFEALIEEPEEKENKSDLGVEVAPGIDDTLDVDWSSIMNAERPSKPQKTSGSARLRFTLAHILSKVGFSQASAGKDLTEALFARCEQQLQAEALELQGEDSKDVAVETKFTMAHPIAGFHVALRQRQKEREMAMHNLGPYRRALCARRDLQIRRLLCRPSFKALQAAFVTSASSAAGEGERNGLEAKSLELSALHSPKPVHVSC